jgi:hypothetical protein
MDTATYEIHLPAPALLPETFTAANATTDASGALLLQDTQGQTLRIYAPGQWLTVSRISGLLQ